MEKTINKIRKLMRLAESANPHEAALALKRATDLMTKHDIDVSTVDMSEEEGAALNKVDGDEVEYDIRDCTHVHIMGQLVAELCSCDMYQIGKRSSTMKLGWVGKEIHREAAKSMFEHLLRSWRRALDQDLKEAKSRDPLWTHMDAIMFRKSHIVGYCEEIIRRVHTLIDERESELKSAGTSMVPTQNAVHEYMESVGVSKKSVPLPPPEGSITGLMAGMKRGRDQNLVGNEVRAGSVGHCAALG